MVTNDRAAPLGHAPVFDIVNCEYGNVAKSAAPPSQTLGSHTPGPPLITVIIGGLAVSG